MIPEFQSSRSLPDKVTDLLLASREGRAGASDKLISLVYGDLRKVARRRFSMERAGHTLQPTAIVNEVILRLFHPVDEGGADWRPGPVDLQNRAHLLSVAARQMRLVLIDHARQKRAGKRDFGVAVPLDDLNHGQPVVLQDHQFEELDQQLDRLAKLDAGAAKVVELKFFGGLTDEEAALAMGTNFAKVRRDWEFARSWLRQRMKKIEKS